MVFTIRNVTERVFLKFTSHADTSVVGLWFLLSYDSNRSSASQKFIGIIYVSPRRSRLNQRVGQQNQLPSPFLSFALWMQTYVYRSGQYSLWAEHCNLMGNPQLIITVTNWKNSKICKKINECWKIKTHFIITPNILPFIVSNALIFVIVITFITINIAVNNCSEYSILDNFFLFRNKKIRKI